MTAAYTQLAQSYQLIDLEHAQRVREPVISPQAWLSVLVIVRPVSSILPLLECEAEACRYISRLTVETARAITRSQVV